MPGCSLQNNSRYFVSMKKKLLVTGAAGFLAHHLLRKAVSDYEVYGIYHTKNVKLPDVTFLSCDLTNYIDIGNLVDDIEPDAIIHTAAISDANYCQQNREESFAINVQAAENLAGICCDLNIPFVFTSTDLVFDGKKGDYKEEDPKNPLSAYGEQKAQAEELIGNIYEPSLILRLPLMFGYPQTSNGNYLQKFITQVKKGETVKLFTDEYRSVGGALSIADGILKFLFQQHGILHLAGGQRLSRYEFGMKAAEAFGLSKDLIQAGSQKDVKMAAQRPADVSLNISKALALGYTPLSVADELAIVAAG